MTEAAVRPFSASKWAEWLADAERRQQEVYRLSPERLIAEYRHERDITRGYHGREILELLQNAADAARVWKIRGKVRIVVTAHGLLVGNTGRPFTAKGVESLQLANLSPKRQRETVLIGDKGLGFRSILNWTDSPLISSGELGLAFVPDYVANIVGSLEKENDELAQRVADEREIAGDLIVPRLAFPQWVADWANHPWPEGDGLRSIAVECQSLRSEGFDTAVGMPFHAPRAYNEAVQQLAELSPEFLLLVDSIGELELRVEGHAPRVWSCAHTEGWATLREGNRVLSSWMVAVYPEEVPEELLDHEERGKNRFQITLAVPEDHAASPGSLFCYFPTEVRVPLPLLVHATVELDETRKHVNDTRANRHILGVVTERIAELAEQQLGRAGAGAWDGCRLVTPQGSWGGELEKFGVPNALKEAAKCKPLIPVLAGGHCIAAQAKLPPSEDAGWWPTRLFPEMVALANKEERAFAKSLDVKALTTAEVLTRLLATDHLSIEERARVIAGLIRCGDPLVGENLTTLLCDDEENPLPIGINAILQPAGDLPALPGWATIRFLHPELRQRLADFLKTADSRELQQHLRAFGIVEYSLSALIRPVMAEANKQVREWPDQESAIRQEALRFLWQVRENLGSATTFPADATVKLLDQTGKWADPKVLYLGEGYGQEGNVTQDLYEGWDQGKLVASPALMGHVAAAGRGVFAHFFSWLGVARWPRETEATKVDSGYLHAVKATLRYPVDFEDCRFATPGELSGARVAGAKTLDGLSEILGKAPPEAVLAWLALDPRAASWSRPAPEHGTLKVRPPNKQYERSYNGAVLSYTHWQITTSEWLPSSDGRKQAPQKCLVGDWRLEVLFPRPAQPDQAFLERYGISERVNEAFRHAGVMPGLAQLGRDELYRLLLAMPDLSPDGKAGRALCRWFISNEGYAFGSAGPYQENFFRQGKVWGSKEGDFSWQGLRRHRGLQRHAQEPARRSRRLCARRRGRRWRRGRPGDPAGGICARAGGSDRSGGETPARPRL